MSGATGNPRWHEGPIAHNPSNTARRNPKPDKHHVESRENLVEISEESPNHPFVGCPTHQSIVRAKALPFHDDCTRGETMSELSRRGFIGSAAAAASLAGLTAAADEDFPLKNNVPHPLLSGQELPTFKFELEKSEAKVIGK